MQHLSGRGGAGNYRSPSREPAVGGPEDYSDTRGRDPIPSRDPDVVCDLLLLPPPWSLTQNPPDLEFMN
jgi:hypothetical protein